MSSADDLYPEPCAFCRISEAYPAPTSTGTGTSTSTSTDVINPIPTSPDPEKISPQCHLILSTPHVLAFLDILPIAPGHILLTTRDHYEKLSDLYTAPTGAARDWISTRRERKCRDTARELGRWLPLVSRALCAVTGIEDWNVVQNNGARAAQVVPHIHFHLIPRYQEGRREVGRKGKVDVGMLKSWKMFGRGAREDLDDDEGRELAGLLRRALSKEIGEEEGGETKSRL